MKKNKFMESGHFPTLIAAFLYFDVSFMVWVMLGPLAPFLSEMLKLTPYQKGLLTAIPLLGGALFRPEQRDRKSTRLNSSHLVISYAVFCLKKKKKPI